MHLHSASDTFCRIPTSAQFLLTHEQNAAVSFRPENAPCLKGTRALSTADCAHVQKNDRKDAIRSRTRRWVDSFHGLAFSVNFRGLAFSVNVRWCQP